MEVCSARLGRPEDSANYLVKMSSQALAAGLSSFGSSIGQGFQNYMAGRERRELLSGEAMAYGSQLKEKQAQGIKLSSNEEAMLKKLENVGDMGTRELQNIIAEYETDEKMEQLQMQKKLHENQLRRDQYFFDQQDRNREIYEREVKRNQAVADVMASYDPQGKIPERKTRVIPAEYGTETYTPDSSFIGPAPEGVSDPRHDLSFMEQVARDNSDGRFMGKTLLPFSEDRAEAIGAKDLINFQIKEVIDSKKSAIEDITKANSSTLGIHSLTQEQKDFARDRGINAPEVKTLNETGRKAVDKLNEDIATLQADMANNQEGVDISEYTKNAIGLYRQGGALDPVQLEAEYTEPVNKRKWTETREVEISPERREEYTEMRPQTQEEKDQSLQNEIVKRASELGAKGIKEVKELVKNSDLQIVELQGTNYVFSPKSGSFQIIPSEKDGSKIQDQIRILKELGLTPEEANVKLLDGTSIKFVIPSKEDGGPKTESQARAYMHAGTMKLTEGVITEMTQGGFDASSIMNSFELYHDQNAIKSPEAKRYAAAMNKWLEAYLRYVSGAAIAEHEYKGARQQFFPVVGDSAEALADKKRLRTGTFALMQKVSGGKANVEELTSQIGSFQLQAGETLRLVSDSEEEATAEAQRRGLKSGDTYTWIDKDKGMEYTYTVD